ncbi:type II toxin-antitoxin system VapB family antitoxin [Vitreimonas flagellata]|uniref:type II toxin-antitoxin system VapB family antitoxin n=1 Tax=Vitreimonas flagellata TaxID=2560861 RepID=UPI003B8334F9
MGRLANFANVDAFAPTQIARIAAASGVALKALIERESARRLARLGGSDPKAKAPPRRRPG